MNLLWLAGLLLLEAPVWTGPQPWPSPTAVTKVETVATCDFQPPQGTAGVTLPPRGTGIVDEGDNVVLRLTPTAREAVTIWLGVPLTARGRYVRISGQVRAESGEAQLTTAAVEGTRTTSAAPDWARRSVAVTAEWRPFTLSWLFPALSDTLAMRVEAGSPAVRLDGLKIEVEHRQRDRQIALLAARSGNLVANGSFEAGSTGFRVTWTHPTLARTDPPITGLLRITDQDPKDGRKCGQTFVVDGPVTMTAPVLALKAGTRYTFALYARARSRTAGRLSFRLLRADGVPFGHKEVALPYDWTRLKTTFTTDRTGSQLYLPEIRAFPTDTPYSIDFDALVVREGDSDRYEPADAVVLAVDDGLAQPLGGGHVAAAGQPVKLTARLLAGSEPLTAVLRGSLVSCLGAVSTPLPEVKVAAEAGVLVETELFNAGLEPGWYQVRLSAMVGDDEVAQAEQSLAVVAPPGSETPWSLGVRWTTPDGLLRGRARSAVLERLPWFGLDSRWIGGNATTFWAAVEPRPGEFATAALAAASDAVRDQALDVVLELDAYPPRDTAPDWLVRGGTVTPEDRVIPAPADLLRHFAGLAKALHGKPLTYALAPSPPSQAAGREALVAAVKAALATGDPAASLLPDDAAALLPELPSAPLDSHHVELSESLMEQDANTALAAQAAALADLVAAGHRRLLWPNQGFWPVGYGRGQQAGLTNPDGGPKPIVAFWATLRRLVPQAQLQGRLDAAGRHAALFGGESTTVLLWADQPGAMQLALPATAKITLATGEQVNVPTADGVATLPLSRWPLFIAGLAAADGAVLAEALAAP